MALFFGCQHEWYLKIQPQAWCRVHTEIYAWKMTYLFARYTNRCAFLHDSSFHHNAHNNWITRVENKLWKNLEEKFDDNAKKIIRNLTTMPKNILEDQNKLLNELKFSLKKCYKLFLKSVRCKQKVFIHEFHENSLWGKIFHYQFNHCHLHLRRGTEFFFTFFVFYPGYSDFLKHVYLVYCVLFRKRIRIQWPSFRAFFR